MKHRSFFAIIFVVILLFGTISFAQARGPGRGRDKGPDRGMGREARHGHIDACFADLDLSSDQIVQFRKIREGHRESMDRIKEEMHKYRIQKRKQMQKGIDADPETSEDLLNQGSELWKEREREMLNYRNQLSGLLTQEQKDKLYMCENFRPKPGWEERQGRVSSSE